MSPQENFTTHKPTISTIAKENYLQPHGVSDEILSDARRINELVKRDAEILSKAGIAPEHIDLLPAKLDCYATAAAEADAAVSTEEQVLTNWNTGQKKGFDFKHLMAHEMEFHYRDNAPIMNELKEIAKGSGRSDMVLDLKKYATVGKNNPAPLEAAPLFDMSWLTVVEELHWELSDLLAKLESNPDDTREANTLKRQSFTWLESSLNEIRSYAKYVFHRDPVKLKEYKRDYWNK